MRTGNELEWTVTRLQPVQILVSGIRRGLIKAFLYCVVFNRKSFVLSNLYFLPAFTSQRGAIGILRSEAGCCKPRTIKNGEVQEATHEQKEERTS